MRSCIPLLMRDDPATLGSQLAILCMVDGPGATWRISFERPLRNARARREVSFCCFEENSIQKLPISQIRLELEALVEETEPSIIILSRCSSIAVQILLEIAKRAGIPTIYHIDDDLFQVPAELGAAKFQYYNSPERQANLRIGCSGADLIYCSTRALYYRLGRFGFATPIVYGEIYCAIPDAVNAFTPKWPLTIGYMGTSGHKTDLELIVPEVLELMQEHPNLRFEVFGSIDLPRELSSAYPHRTAKFAPTSDYDAFLARLGELGWAVGVAPLRDMAFNTVKANTKFIEYAAAGIPCVVSSGQVYDDVVRHGAAPAASRPDEWRAAIDELLDDLDKAAAQLNTAQHYAQAKFSTAKLAEQVFAVIDCAMQARARAVNQPANAAAHIGSGSMIEPSPGPC